MAMLSLLNTKSEIGFQNFVLVIVHWEMNLDQDAHQTLIKMLWKNWWNAICTKVFEN